MSNKGNILNLKKEPDIKVGLGKKVYVGLSGGVDSSVSAALLKEQGYDVTGVFIKVWQPEFVKCSWREDRLDAMRICAKLDIPFKDLDLEKEYKKEVFDYMIYEYKTGRTPNPDVMCNKSIKFGGFLEWALESGADYIATGHYARIKKNGKVKMLAGVDNNKDQTYFLWTLSQERLRHILFPIGDLEKPEVRKLAKKYNLLTAEKKDSQGLCFVGMVEMKEFLKLFLPEKKGDVLNEKGEVVGFHDGAYYYTLGQRHGFTITKKTPDDRPKFVINKDVNKNTITVSDKKRGEVDQRISDKKEIEIENINWIGGEEPSPNKKYKARIRYRQELQDCKIIKEPISGEVKVIFDEVQKSVSSGQSVVVYDEEECLGGGIIK